MNERIDNAQSHSPAPVRCVNTMKYLMMFFSVFILAGCSTTPGTEQQMLAADARSRVSAHKAWCRQNDGVFVEDDTRGNKCFRRAEFNAAIRRHADQQQENHESMHGFTADDGPADRLR